MPNTKPSDRELLEQILANQAEILEKLGAQEEVNTEIIEKLDNINESARDYNLLNLE